MSILLRTFCCLASFFQRFFIAVISLGDQMLLRLHVLFRSNAWTVGIFTVHEKHLGAVEVAHVGTIPTCLHLTSWCDPPLLFVYF